MGFSTVYQQDDLYATAIIFGGEYVKLIKNHLKMIFEGDFNSCLIIFYVEQLRVLDIVFVAQGLS